MTLVPIVDCCLDFYQGDLSFRLPYVSLESATYMYATVDGNKTDLFTEQYGKVRQ